MKIRMFSYGGSGYRFMSKFLHDNYVETTWPTSIHPYIAHNRPRDEFGQYDKIIFIYGDPRNALLSHVRRCDGYNYIKDTKGNYKFGTRRFRQLSEPFEISTKITEDKITLMNFLTKYPDYLDFNGFFKSWLEYPFPKDYTLFLRYEDIGDNISQLADFLGLRNKFKQHLSREFKPTRRTDFSKSFRPVVRKLDEQYRELIKMQNQMGSFYVK